MQPYLAPILNLPPGAPISDAYAQQRLVEKYRVYDPSQGKGMALGVFSPARGVVYEKDGGLLLGPEGLYPATEATPRTIFYFHESPDAIAARLPHGWM